MDRKSLQGLESRCIQEEAPACVAACPIHVDVKAFLAKVAAGAWDEAVRVLASVMPLPGIVGRICDHPCEEKCLRRDAGGTLVIGDLERAALARGGRNKERLLLPPKDRSVAVVGGGLAGLVAAWDLARKGYKVTILARAGKLGESLREIPEQVLPHDVIGEEIALLEEMGVAVRSIEGSLSPDSVKSVRGEFDAVYASTPEPGRIDPIPGLRGIEIDPVTLSTREEGLFVGRPKEGAFSWIGAVAEGRKAATSIDRYLQGVSLNAGREQEAPYESRLYTNLKRVVPEPVTPMKDASGYNEEEARKEAGRCIGCECMECVKECLFLERFKSFPKRYVRQISNDETMVMGSHGPTIKLVNSCTLCGLCEVVCPNALSMAAVAQEGRVSLVRRGKMAPSAHDLALDDMLSSNSDRATIALHEPGKAASKYAFFPGCQMAAIYPDHVVEAYAYLRAHLKGGTALMLRCCGVPAEWAAREDLLQDALHDLEADWVRLGRPTMVAACPTCYKTLRKHLPEIDTVTLWQVLAKSGGPPRRQAPSPGKLAVHDPCTTRYEPEIHDSVRTLLTRWGYSVEELPLSRGTTECCGFGGLAASANPGLAKDVATRRGSESPIDYVTYCAMCRNALAASGKRIFHLLDLIFSSSPDAAAQKALGHSDRQENRFRLKRTLLAAVWGRQSEDSKEHEKVALLMSHEVAARMEERRILREDVRRTILDGQASGNKLFNPVTMRWCASFRPSRITYWVEYSPEGEGFRVHNAYCHRMEVVGAETGAAS